MKVETLIIDQSLVAFVLCWAVEPNLFSGVITFGQKIDHLIEIHQLNPEHWRLLLRHAEKVTRGDLERTQRLTLGNRMQMWKAARGEACPWHNVAVTQIIF